jgi:hypothetical protein
VAFCRTYISSEDVLIHFDNEISLIELRREANEVREAIYGAPRTLPYHFSPIFCHDSNFSLQWRRPACPWIGCVVHPFGVSDFRPRGVNAHRPGFQTTSDG